MTSELQAGWAFKLVSAFRIKDSAPTGKYQVQSECH
jgi:hypothetical protein